MNKKLENAFALLKTEYKGLTCALHFKNNFELLIAVSLSAQTTDNSVNKVTPKLFEKYRNVNELSKAKTSDVEKILNSIGMYKTKAKNIVNASKKIVADFNSEVPNNFDDLISLAGVGRKTANVVLSIGFNVQAMPVDTHVFRVSNRIGFVNETTPEKTEQSLMKVIPYGDWNNAHNAFIWHGRRVCKAINPSCNTCLIQSCCKYFKALKTK